MAVLLAKHPAVPQYDLTSCKMALSGAAPLTAEVLADFRKRLPGCEMGQAYGESQELHASEHSADI